MKQETSATSVRWVLAGLIMSVALAAHPWPAMAETCCPAHTPQVLPQGFVVQGFPAGEPTARTGWIVGYEIAAGNGLIINNAWFYIRGRGLIQVLEDARLVEIFVPYHPGRPRYLDLGNQQPLELSQADAGCCGVLLPSNDQPFVVKEVRDYGLLYKDHWRDEVRRGQELVLWVVIPAGNYVYVLEYGLRDDGTITFRLGSTAYNLPRAADVAHSHTAVWRIDPALAGPDHDSVLLASHSESIQAEPASDAAVPFANGFEGYADWDPAAYTALRIFDTQETNNRGEAISYDLMAWRWGTPRHAEPWAHHDFWVTRDKAVPELDYALLSLYVAQLPRESTRDTDVVLWHLSAAHHLPRREDGFDTNGVALAMWSGFHLRPRNLFDGTPLHSFCSDGSAIATVGGLNYPDFSCPRAISDAEANRTGFHYRQACADATGGAPPDEVVRAQVRRCDSGDTGATVEVRVCCP